jgi:hypothetical protein
VTSIDTPANSAVTATAPPAAADHARSVQVPRFDAASARELLARTAELPGTKRELLDVLSEYRAAVFAFAFSGDRS